MDTSTLDTLRKEYYSDTDFQVDIHEDDSHTKDEKEIGFLSSHDQLHRHISIDGFAYKSVLGEDPVQFYQSAANYKNPARRYTKKQLNSAPYIIKLQTQSSVPTHEEWEEVKHAINEITEVFSELDTELSYVVRAKLDTLYVVSKQVNINKNEELQQYNTFKHYINAEQVIFNTKEDFIKKLHDFEFSVPFEKKIGSGKYTSMKPHPKLYLDMLEALSEEIVRLQNLSSIERTDELDSTKYQGIGPKKAKKLSNTLNREFTSNPFKTGSESDTDLATFGYSYLQHYLTLQWICNRSLVSVDVCTPYTLLPIQNTLSKDMIRTAYYDGASPDDIPRWSDDLKSRFVENKIGATSDIDAMEKEIPEYYRRISTL